MFQLYYYVIYNWKNHKKIYLEKFLKHFVVSFELIYSIENLSHNIYGFLFWYLANDAWLYGSLDQFSTFKYDNFMQQLLKLIFMENHPIQQVINGIIYYIIEWIII